MQEVICCMIDIVLTETLSSQPHKQFQGKSKQKLFLQTRPRLLLGNKDSFISIQGVSVKCHEYAEYVISQFSKRGNRSFTRLRFRFFNSTELTSSVTTSLIQMHRDV